jgi:hypothetical protein
MERKPVSDWEKHCLDTYILDAVDDYYFPVRRLSRTLKNTGVFTGTIPNTVPELVEAICANGNVAYCMFRRLVKTLVSYELYLNLRSPAELYRWIWVSPCGDGVVKKSQVTYKDEDECVKEGNKNLPPYVHVCLESEKIPGVCGIILV